MATDYCDSFCAPDASAEDLHTILSIFPKQKPSNSFTTEGGKAGKVGPNEDESVGADLANGLSLTSWRQARNSIITVVCSLCESSTERQTKKCFMEQKKLNNALRHSAKGTNNFVGVGSKLSSKNHRWGD